MAIREYHSMLVTGGRGFIGRAVCSLLRRQGLHVVSLDMPAGAAAGTDPAADLLCDIGDLPALESVFKRQRFDGIIHLAAILPTSAQRDPLRATQVNIGGSLNVLEMARQFGVRRFVFGSSLSVYGTCPAEESVTENHRAAPEDLYGAAKLYFEQLGEAYRSQHGLEFVSLRIGRVVGPGAKSTSSAWRSQIFENLHTDAPAEICLPFLPSERILLIHVEDVARMLVMLLVTPRLNHGIYNACCESVVVEELRHSLESLNPRLRISLGSQPAAGNPRRLDCSRFESELDFHPKPISEQLRTAAAQVKT